LKQSVANQAGLVSPIGSEGKHLMVSGFGQMSVRSFDFFEGLLFSNCGMHLMGNRILCLLMFVNIAPGFRGALWFHVCEGADRKC
jgi:hypothetical protein